MALVGEGRGIGWEQPPLPNPTHTHTHTHTHTPSSPPASAPPELLDQVFLLHQHRLDVTQHAPLLQPHTQSSR